MSGTMSKRQQARNEKTLQDLVHNVTGNSFCADCHARNPAWASWSLGVFLCMRCAAIHRKLGTHISKVKSLSMDSWSNEQVDNMRKVGNIASNQIYNPENKKPTVPIDADEADSAMERFIRQKYAHNAAAPDPAKPRSPYLDEGVPPPLPPKNSKFSFRSASSIFPLTSKAKKEARFAAAMEAGHTITTPSAPPRGSSRDFGAGTEDSPEDTKRKLAQLVDIGFPDMQKNAMVLKGVNGNLEQAVDALVRLGEKSRRSPLPSPPVREPALRTARSFTPMSSTSTGLGAGLSIDPPSKVSGRPTTASNASNNPFDSLPSPAPTQTAQSTGTLQNNNPYANNPFGAPSSLSTDTVNQAMQKMSLSTPQQPLFPHHTGGLASPQPFSPQHPQQQMPMQPSQHIPSLPQHSMTYPQPNPQQMPSYNPYGASPVSATSPFQQQGQMNFGVGNTTSYASNPYTKSPTRMTAPNSPLGQIPEQTQPIFQSPMGMQPAGANPFFSSPMQSPAPMAHNPYAQLPQQQVQPQAQMYQTQQAQQSYQQQQAQQPQPHTQVNYQAFQQTPRHDKASIMALYGQTSTQPQASPQAQTLQNQPILENQPFSAPTQPAASQSYQAPGNALSGMGQSNNPFMNNGANMNPATDRKISRESVNLSHDLAWTNGRHSPDAFASLSAQQ